MPLTLRPTASGDIREVGFCVEHRTRAGRSPWCIGSRIQGYLRSARAWRSRGGRSTLPDSRWRAC